MYQGLRQSMCLNGTEHQQDTIVDVGAYGQDELKAAQVNRSAHQENVI